jgi:hypothetical protein
MRSAAQVEKTRQRNQQTTAIGASSHTADLLWWGEHMAA